MNSDVEMQSEEMSPPCNVSNVSMNTPWSLPPVIKDRSSPMNDNDLLVKRLYTEKGANSLGPLQHEEIQKTCDSLNAASQGQSQANLTEQLLMSVDDSPSYKRTKPDQYVDISFKYKPQVEQAIFYYNNEDLSDVSDEADDPMQLITVSELTPTTEVVKKSTMLNPEDRETQPEADSENDDNSYPSVEEGKALTSKGLPLPTFEYQVLQSVERIISRQHQNHRHNL